ncbi:MAG: hypothetical protein V2I33_08685 [Kangiellaceae bacterium]|jgi:hypothetical protein|nr:hypothetical protein [Kangiellaceae bacterium]
MNQETLPDVVMDDSSLFREETITDQKVGTIRVMTPITAEGADDTTRQVEYIGQTQIMTPAGALPLNFEIPADNLAEAVTKFGQGAKEAMERTMEELKEMRRQQASSIVMPGDPAMGGSNIQMP